jgi:hypothetical protein
VDWADHKALARRTVHDTFAVEAFYEDDTTAQPVGLKVRYHNRLDRSGIGGSDGFAAVLEGIDRLVFDREELARKGVTLQAGAKVSFPKYGVAFNLETMDPKEGPVTVIWTVS